jgi:uncharacterized protein (TIGR02145 family)
MRRLQYIGLLLLLAGCTQKKVKDITSVTFGTQVWMAENLNVNRFRNGDSIPEAKTADEWEQACDNKQPAWCYYENATNNGAFYGKLYNWYAVNDPRGLAPEGWHVPTDEEWTILTDGLGGKKVAGKKMKSSLGWDENGHGTNTSRFDGRPGGFRYYSLGIFQFRGTTAFWWSASSATTDTTDSAWGWYLNCKHSGIYKINGNKCLGYSVRCIKD